MRLHDHRDEDYGTLLHSSAKNARLLMRIYGISTDEEGCLTYRRLRLLVGITRFLIRLIIAEAGVVSVIGAGRLIFG